ncbi:MAG: diaminopimelate epimerase [Gallionellaceae bacterium]|jgi:diaminopimelate epimerase|nr:diaminopimelate epimerase [Gallionellaceae bacterium]
MRLKFTKMHASGNDFVVLDGVRQSIRLAPEQLRLLADRHFGVGCDHILLVESSDFPGADFRYRTFNADGEEVAQYGNGARCFVRFAHDRRLTHKREITAETRSGLITPRLEDDGRITMNMGAPIFEPARIPFATDSDALIQPLEIGDAIAQITAVRVNTPHAVQVVDDVRAAPVETQGALIARHPRFPNHAHAAFMQIIDRGHIRLRVYHHDAGEKLSYGPSACAAVAAGIRRGLLDDSVQVVTHGGKLNITWAGDAAPIMMTGSAITVFEGEITI